MNFGKRQSQNRGEPLSPPAQGGGARASNRHIWFITAAIAAMLMVLMTYKVVMGARNRLATEANSAKNMRPLDARVEPAVVPVGAMEKSSNARGLPDSEVQNYSDGSRQRKTFSYQPNGQIEREATYNRDGTSSTTTYSYRH